MSPSSGRRLCRRNISTKSIGVPPGDVSSEQIDVANWADQYSYSEIRISHEQNFVLPHVAGQTCSNCGSRPQPSVLAALTWASQRHDLLPGRRLLLAG